VLGSARTGARSCGQAHSASAAVQVKCVRVSFVAPQSFLDVHATLLVLYSRSRGRPATHDPKMCPRRLPCGLLHAGNGPGRSVEVRQQPASGPLQSRRCKVEPCCIDVAPLGSGTSRCKQACGWVSLQVRIAEAPPEWTLDQIAGLVFGVCPAPYCTTKPGPRAALALAPSHWQGRQPPSYQSAMRWMHLGGPQLADHFRRSHGRKRLRSAMVGLSSAEMWGPRRDYFWRQ